MDPYVRKNQELWDEWTEINVRSAFYDVAGFKKQPPPLDPVVVAGLGDLAGKSVLHLQCHFGLDTLRIAAAGARDVVGIDLSPKAIAFASGLAADLGNPARFVQSDVYALPEVLDGEFDVVFTSVGVLGWLPDLGRWAAIVARYLARGGRFFILESHPTMDMFDGESAELRLAYPYFPQREPIEFPPVIGNYADPTAPVTKPGYAWPHSLAEIVTSLLGAGLRLESLEEHAYVPWKAFPFLVEVAEPGRERAWRMPGDRPQLPMMFSLRATKP